MTGTDPAGAARMYGQGISLRQLRFFATLAETSNFSRAAERLGLSQPALSGGIRQLEALTEARLFDRTTHRVTLTEAGRALLPHAQRLLTTADNAFADMRDATAVGHSIVRIGAIPSAVPAVAQAIATFGRNPPVNVHIRDGKSDALIASLLNGAIDLAVCVVGEAHAGLVACDLAEDDMLLMVPAGHRLNGAERLRWSALDGYEIVHFAGGSIGELTSAAMRQNGLLPSARYKVDQVDSLVGIVVSGLALGIMPRLYTRAFRHERLSLIPLVRPNIRRRITLLHRRALRTEHPEADQTAIRLGPMLKAEFERV